MDDEDEERLGSDEEGSRSTWSLSLSLASSKRTRRVLDDELEEDVEDWKGARSKKQERVSRLLVTWKLGTHSQNAPCYSR